jgi:hypothetical protein
LAIFLIRAGVLTGRRFMRTARSLMVLTLGLGLCLGTVGCSDSATSTKTSGSGPKMSPDQMKDAMEKKKEMMDKEKAAFEQKQKDTGSDKAKPDDKNKTDKDKPGDKGKSD